MRFDLLGDLQMDRLQFSRQILQKELECRTNQLEYIFAYPGKKIFEVIFTTGQHLENCMDKFEQKRRSVPAFKKINMTPLVERDLKMVHVMIYSEKVRNQDVLTWMRQYCEVIHGIEVVDLDGIKTGARRFHVRLSRREGILQHLPNTIQLGALRGYVFYPGQPKECRKCGSQDHLAAACTTATCRNCKSTDHTTVQCKIPVKCNLCSSTDHRFRDCPHAYSNRVKQSKIGQIVLTHQEPATEEPADSQLLITDIVTEPPTSGTTDQQPSEEADKELEKETQGITQAVDWSALAPDEDEEPSNFPPIPFPFPNSSFPPSPSLQKAQSLIKPTHEPHLSPVTLQKVGNLLDKVMADVVIQAPPTEPVPSGQAPALLGTEQPNPASASPPPQSLMEQARGTNQPTQSSLATTLGLGSSTAGPPSRKRPQELNSSGEPSPSLSPISSLINWSSSPPSANPFLEQEDVIAFSTTTLIKNVPQDGFEPKKHKKKKKKNSLT